MNDLMIKSDDVVEGEFRKVYYLSYLREDFVERVVKLLVSRLDIVEEIFFSSNNFGTTYWQNRRGFVDSHRWENEDAAQSASNLSKHYTTLLIDGEVSEDYALHKIVDDVVDYLPDKNLRNRLIAIVTKNEKDPILGIEI